MGACRCACSHACTRVPCVSQGKLPEGRGRGKGGGRHSGRRRLFRKRRREAPLPLEKEQTTGPSWRVEGSCAAPAGSLRARMPASRSLLAPSGCGLSVARATTPRRSLGNLISPPPTPLHRLAAGPTAALPPRVALTAACCTRTPRHDDAAATEEAHDIMLSAGQHGKMTRGARVCVFRRDGELRISLSRRTAHQSKNQTSGSEEFINLG